VKFIDEVTQSYGVDPRRLYLMGFSQGAMMSFSVGLRWPDKVAGIVAMSGRLPEQVLAEISQPETLRGMPVFVAHGVYDPVIPVQYGRECRAALEKLPVTLTYREYAMAHEVSPESLSDIAAWLQAVLDRSAPHW
jgi:phospholipase/carboxylesterase